MSRTLGIIGVGLIGGSVGLAARDAGWQVVGVDRPDTLEKAVDLGAIDRASTLKEVRGADLVVLAAPISKVTDLVAQLPPTHALVTDVASAKSAVVGEAERQNLRFVGGHPMSGSQLSGVANASADLFKVPVTSSPRPTTRTQTTTAGSPGSSGSSAPSQPP